MFIISIILLLFLRCWRVEQSHQISVGFPVSTGATGYTGFAGTVLAAGARDSQCTNSLSLMLLESHDLLELEVFDSWRLIIDYTVLFFFIINLIIHISCVILSFLLFLGTLGLNGGTGATGITEDFLDLIAATGAAGSLETNWTHRIPWPSRS